MNYQALVKTFVAIAMLFLLLLQAACSADEEPSEVVEIDESVETVDSIEEDLLVEGPLQDATYYWPWISHGQVELSSGEIIIGPDLFESELGFIGEFAPDDSYEGRLVWRVADTDVFTLDWIALYFDVDYFEQSEWQSVSTFEFVIDNLQTEPGDDGIREVPVNVTDQHENFEVTIRNITLGKEAEGSFSTDPISYIAFDITMRVFANQ